MTSWSDEFDVVVIGFGIAGGCRRGQRRGGGRERPGARRAAAAGGTSAMAGGHFYLGGGTAVQQATGHDDRPTRCTSTSSRYRRSPISRRSAPTAMKASSTSIGLRRLAFEFERSYWKGKVVVPPGTEGLSYTGNEKVWPFCEQAKPAPRGHSVPVPGELGGASMVIDLLLKRAADPGVQIRYETGVTNLVVDDGDVVGVRWKHFGENGAINAKAVVIAAGGFAMNADMVAEYTPALGQERQAPNTTGGGAVHSGQPPRRRPRHPDSASRRAASPRTWTGCSSPPPRTRRKSCSPASSSTTRASDSSPRTPTIRAHRLSCSSNRTSRRTSSSTRRTCRCPRCR